MVKNRHLSAFEIVLFEFDCILGISKPKNYANNH